MWDITLPILGTIVKNEKRSTVDPRLSDLTGAEDKLDNPNMGYLH